MVWGLAMDVKGWTGQRQTKGKNWDNTNNINNKTL